MAYIVDLTARAERDLAHLYEQIRAEHSGAATPESDKFRHLLYGNKPPIYRALYRVLEKQKRVEAMHIRRGARQTFKGSDVT